MIYLVNKVSSQAAHQLISVCVELATKLGKGIAISIAGPEGEEIAFLRMDGVAPASSRIAKNKAYTAAVDRKSTAAMNEYMQANARPQAYWGDERITGFGGGITIRYQGAIIGGLGVSGLTQLEDIELAKEAINRVGLETD